MKKNSLCKPKERGKGIFLRLQPSALKSLIGLLIILLFNCSRKEPDHKADGQALPPKSQVKYARGFSIEYHHDFKIINILNHFEDNTDTLKYILVPRGRKTPAHFESMPVIQTPVERLVGASSMHIALAELLDAPEILVGLGDFEYVNSTVVRDNIKNGKIKEVGLGGSMNNELILSLKPDLVMVMGSPDAKLTSYQALQQMGIPIMVNAEWLEDHPLGRAEWVKLMAALLDKEDMANQKFEEIEREYLRLAALTQRLPNKPRVMIGMSFKDAWHVPDGDSYMAQFMRDAGADYNWYGVKAKGSLPLDFEAAYADGLKADYWLNVGYVDSKKEIEDKDKRYVDLKPFQNGNIFNNNGKVNDIGSNDYWESGAVRPDIVLADMIKILHPELLADHQLVYYKKIL